MLIQNHITTFIKIDKMLGVILCGGLSSRMGTDKGLLKFNATNWARIAFDKMSLLKLPVVLSVNANQFNEYSALFPASKLIKDQVPLQIHGPLCGVLSVHLQHPREDLFVLACDMPLMDIDILQQLYTLYCSEPSNDAFVFSNDGEPEPLCGIYKAKGLAFIMHLFTTNQLIRHSMKFIIEHMKTFLIPLREDQKKYFTNINTHAELNGL